MTCNTSAQPISASSARSIASTCPRIRRTRASSLDFSRTVCVMTARLPTANIGGYSIWSRLRLESIRYGVIASVLVMSAHAADAHGILGHRLFAGTLSFDGRVVADEAVCLNSRAVPERDAVVGSEFAFLKNK